ncbi:restriction endonuclease [Desulfobulbus sp. F4]|nr:restriction endonuclease [Desulfobulbus sp. F4]
MAKKIKYELKEAMVSLSGACFWYWNSFYSFLDSSGVSRRIYGRFPKEAYRKYDVMRNILGYLEENDEVEIINSLISNFFCLRGAVDKDALDDKKAKKLLSDFKELVGLDPIEQEIERRKREKARNNYTAHVEEIKSHKKRLEELNTLFIALATSSEYTPQQRGYKLEDIFCDILQLSELEYSRPYQTPDGEQIDGHFRFEKFDYLVESKWEADQIKQKDLSVFDGKIRGKAQSTRGLFLSANGFNENAVHKFSGDSPRIILMTGEDLAMILNCQVLFFDAMKAKVEAIVRYGNINFPLRNI